MGTRGGACSPDRDGLAGKHEELKMALRNLRSDPIIADDDDWISIGKWHVNLKDRTFVVSVDAGPIFADTAAFSAKEKMGRGGQNYERDAQLAGSWHGGIADSGIRKLAQITTCEAATRRAGLPYPLTIRACGFSTAMGLWDR